MKEARYFYVPQASERSELPVEEAIHAMRVLRLKSGNEIFLMDGEGCFYRAVVLLSTAKKCLYEIRETIPQQKSWRNPIHLAIAPTKMIDRMEWLVEKATEIGFDELSFLNCDFSERKIIRTDRMDKIIISAMKQSRKSWKPVVHPIQPFKMFVNQPRVGRKFIAHCHDEIDREDFFGKIQSHHGSPLTIMIGPEGDFSADEVRMAISCGYESISLGESRLRTETAGLSAVMLSHLVSRSL